jgi:hypothetical protein
MAQAYLDATSIVGLGVGIMALIGFSFLTVCAIGSLWEMIQKKRNEFWE